jgi:hypothetical protein
MMRIKILIEVEGGDLMTERALMGWREIAEFMRWSESKAKRKKDELLKAGVIFYSRTGRPPILSVQAFPAVLQDWIMRKSLKRKFL